MTFEDNWGEDVVRVALSGPTTPSRVLELFFVAVVVPFETVNGPLVPVVPVESIAEAVAAPSIDIDIAITEDLKIRRWLKRDDRSLTIPPNPVTLQRSFLDGFRVLPAEKSNNPRVGKTNLLSTFSRSFGLSGAKWMRALPCEEHQSSHR